MTKPGLLQFHEAYFEKIWGGRKLEHLFAKPLPPEKMIGEAWLVSDHHEQVSIVSDGPWTGRSLHDIVTENPANILGSRAALTIHGQFPLLLKILDANDYLSVQVHPDDACSVKLNEPDVGKTEMWYVLDTEPGSELVCGLDASVTPKSYLEHVKANTLNQVMNRFQVSSGDAVFVPAGTVHAIGAGIVLAEIQQNSDLTYRIYDWGRVQSDGTPRSLHLDKAVQAIHFNAPVGGPAIPLSYEHEEIRRTVLAACQYFAAERLELSGTHTLQTNGESFHILLGVKGPVSIAANDTSARLSPGKAVLVPGSVREFQIQGDGQFLLYYVPDVEKNILQPLYAAGHTLETINRFLNSPGR